MSEDAKVEAVDLTGTAELCRALADDESNPARRALWEHAARYLDYADREIRRLRGPAPSGAGTPREGEGQPQFPPAVQAFAEGERYALGDGTERRLLAFLRRQKHDALADTVEQALAECRETEATPPPE